MQPEFIVSHVVFCLIKDAAFTGNFDHLTQDNLFQFLLSPQQFLKNTVAADLNESELKYLDAAMDIAHYEVVLALRRKVEKK